MVVSTRRRTRSQGSAASVAEEQPPTSKQTSASKKSAKKKAIEKAESDAEEEEERVDEELKQENAIANEEELEHQDGNDNSDDDAPSTSKGKKQKNDNLQSSAKSSRESRKKRREDLRSKSLGLVHIAKDGESATKPNRKIVFGDAKEDDESEGAKGEQEDEAVDGGDQHDNDIGDNGEDGGNDDKDDKNEDVNDNDSSDDEVEQVDTSAARDLAIKEEARERAISQQQASNKKKKRKSHYEQQQLKKQAELDALDEDFFAQLDAHKQEVKQAKKQRKHQQPKHTIFTTTGDAIVEDPVEVNPSMELVVLGTGAGGEDGDNQMELETLRRMQATIDTAPPSKLALMNSRSLVVDEPIATQKQLQKQKKHGLAVPGANWKRSKKMNRLLLGGGRKRGVAAANFVTAKQPQKTFKF